MPIILALTPEAKAGGPGFEASPVYGVLGQPELYSESMSEISP